MVRYFFGWERRRVGVLRADQRLNKIPFATCRMRVCMEMIWVLSKTFVAISAWDTPAGNPANISSCPCPLSRLARSLLLYFFDYTRGKHPRNSCLFQHVKNLHCILEPLSLSAYRPSASAYDVLRKPGQPIKVRTGWVIKGASSAHPARLHVPIAPPPFRKWLGGETTMRVYRL